MPSRHWLWNELTAKYGGTDLEDDTWLQAEDNDFENETGQESGLLFMAYEDLHQEDDPDDDDLELDDSEDSEFYESERDQRINDGYIDSADYLRNELKGTFDERGAALDRLERYGNPVIGWDPIASDDASVVTYPSHHAAHKSQKVDRSEFDTDEQSGDDVADVPTTAEPQDAISEVVVRSELSTAVTDYPEMAVSNKGSKKATQHRSRLSVRRRRSHKREQKRSKNKKRVGEVLRQLERLVKLRQTGMLTEEEFRALKRKILG